MSTSTTSTGRPSFDELLKTTHTHSPISTTSPTPKRYPKGFSHGIPEWKGPAHSPRPPSTPPSPPQSRQKAHPPRRARATSAPALSRRGTYPVTRPDFRPHHSHASRASMSHEHYGNRISEIKSGDGDIELYDAVAPEVLPSCARPHFHGRHCSTPLLPIHIHHSITPPRPKPIIEGYEHNASAVTTQGHPHHPHPHISIAHSPNQPAQPIPVSGSHPYELHHAHSFGSHSPLSTSNPLTPQSIHSYFDTVLNDTRKDSQ